MTVLIEPQHSKESFSPKSWLGSVHLKLEDKICMWQ